MKITESRLIQCGFEFVSQKLNFDLLEKLENKIPHSRYYHFVLNGYYQIECEKYEKEFDAVITEVVKIYKIKGRFGKHQWILCYNSYEFYEICTLEELLSICNNIYHNKQLGFVYVIKSDFGYKIGQSNNLTNRNRQFEVKLPFDWSFYKIYTLEKFKEMEKMSHELMADKRINGEWFNLDDKDFVLFDLLYKQLIL
jgi:hypothetical protein